VFSGSLCARLGWSGREGYRERGPVAGTWRAAQHILTGRPQLSTQAALDHHWGGYNHTHTHARTPACMHTHTHTHACTHTHTHANTHACTHAHTQSRTHTHTHTHSLTLTHTHAHTHTHMPITTVFFSIFSKLKKMGYKVFLRHWRYLKKICLYLSTMLLTCTVDSFVTLFILYLSVWFCALQDEQKRINLRHLDICSVDPPGCTDIDDALHCRRLENGNFEVCKVGIHILPRMVSFVSFPVSGASPFKEIDLCIYYGYPSSGHKLPSLLID
jgi:hypothetical protein